MIRINPFLPIQNTDRTASAKRKKEAQGSSLFAGLLGAAEASDEVAEAAPLTETTAMSAINPMLSFQEVSDGEMAIKQGIKQGRLTLDALEDLRHALLMGAVPVHTLHQLEKLVREQKSQSPDPRLNAILDDIELRAAVELAKLEMAQALRSE